MARNEMSEQKIARFKKEGRGTGLGDDYIPWLQVTDVPGRSAVTQISPLQAWKFNRAYHLMSRFETRYFKFLESLGCVVDVREQFPLTERDYAQDIARELNVKYPTDWKTQTAIIMTCDFLITVRDKDGETYDIARTLKLIHDLTLRAIEKFQIEKIYMREVRNVTDWGIVTPKQLPINYVDNIEDIYPYKHKTSIGLDDEDMERLAFDLTKRVLNNQRPINDIATECDHDNRAFVQQGTSLRLVKFLIANRIWIIDMHKRIYWGRPLQILNTNSLGY